MATENRIFLAHASEDKPQVRQLYEKLKARGFSPWFDEVDLTPGQIWREEIPKAIREAAICLACLSKRSVAKRSYVQREFRYALSACADLPDGSIYLIPVRLDDCEVPDLQIPELELKLRDRHWVDLFADGGFEKLVGAIELQVKGTRRFADFEVFRDIDAPWCPEMVMIPAGTFLMGSPEDEEGRDDNEGPQHEVTISQAFALGRYPITFDEYDHFCNQTNRKKPEDAGWGRGRRPVIQVNAEDAQAYCAWLSETTQASYRLPTEAEWEYACRASTMTAYAFGDQITQKQANFGHGRAGKTSEIGAYLANPWGLHDMHGNVSEWCADGRRTYEKGPVTDPEGLPVGTSRVLRGGSWFGLARHARSAFRYAFDPGSRNYDFGFRCARVLEPEKLR